MRKSKAIIFLDFDGVVNTLYWRYEGEKLTCSYCHPSDGRVNNLQAICWLNELNKKHGFNIVVTSSWAECIKPSRSHRVKVLSEWLYNSGLDRSIKIIDGIDTNDSRPVEILKWLKIHKYTGKFIILDDEDWSYGGKGYNDYKKLKENFILVNGNVGFSLGDYYNSLNVLGV